MPKEIIVRAWEEMPEELVAGKTNEDGTRARCGAVKKNGIPCRNWAMDNGRCKFHGGRDVDDVRLDPENPRNVPGRPPIHGRYSKYLRHEIGTRYEEFEGDKDFMNLQSEVAYLRAVTSRLLEMMDNNEDMDLDEIAGIVKLAEGTRKLVDTFMKIEQAKKYALNPDEVMRILTAVVQIITKHVTDERTVEKIRNELLSINI